MAISEDNHQALTASLFIVVVLITVGITFWASRQTHSATDYYAGGRSFTGAQNGLAVSGDYMSAASFLGISGAIALSGYDGFLYSIGFLVAWLVALLLIAELLRNSGRYTMADQLAYRMKQTPVRTAAATSTVVVSIFYLLAQMVGAGALVTLLLGVTDEGAKNWVIVGVGLLMIFYVTVGGMKGTTWVQIVKAVLLMAGTILITFLVLLHFHFNISEMLGAAVDKTGKPGFLDPGLKYGVSTTSKIDFVSLGLALVLGTAGLPHILIRFYTVPTSKTARTSVLWAIGLIGAFYLMTLVLGFGAAALLDTGPGQRGRREHRQPRLTAARRRGRRWRRQSRRLGAARVDLGGGVRDHPGGRRRADPDVGVERCPRPVCQRDQEGQGDREAGGQGRPRRCLRDRLHRDPAGDTGAEAQHRLPGRAGVRGRCVGQPAVADLQPVLAALQHPRRRLEHLRRAGVVGRPGLLLARRLRQGRPGHRRERCRCSASAPTSAGSRWRTRASSRSRSGS